MSSARVGTRGSDLALWQTRWVIAALQRAHRDLEVEEVIITTHGDAAVDQPFDAETWPAGAFVGAIEQALAAGEIDFAVHSCKDLPTRSAPGLIIAAYPPRAAANDVLVTSEPVDLDDLPAGFRVGTSSPRRRFQMLRHADVEIVPLRGNVPTRLRKAESVEYDGVILAQAGLNRLDLSPRNAVTLPVDRFVPAPAQGAMAVQAREHSKIASMPHLIDDEPTRRAVEAERAVLAGVSATCHTPIGAHATLENDQITLHAQLFSDDGESFTEVTMSGDDPQSLGGEVAARLRREVKVSA